jgi:hypothetical protein
MKRQLVAKIINHTLWNAFPLAVVVKDGIV